MITLFGKKKEPKKDEYVPRVGDTFIGRIIKKEVERFCAGTSYMTPALYDDVQGIIQDHYNDMYMISGHWYKIGNSIGCVEIVAIIPQDRK